MRRLILSIALLGASSTASDAQPRPDLTAFDRYVAQGVRDWGVPGLSIAIVKDDSVVFARGYGVRQLGKPERVDEHTLFAIGSTTKAMTALSLLMLEDEGKLRLSDPTIKYIPTLQLYDPVMTRELTVRDLLTHHTGLPTSDYLWSGGDYDVTEIIRRMRYLKPVTSFRNAYNYQNVQYAMAGEVISAASGVPWDRTVQSRIFAPLGMQRSVPYLAATRTMENVATPHLTINDTVQVIENRPVDPVGPAGSIWSSARDMAQWMRFVLDSGRVRGQPLVTKSRFIDWLTPQVTVPRASFYPTTALTNPHFITYGLGWFLHDYQGMSVAMHTGSIDGMIAIIGLVPDKRLGVYVLANLDHAELRHALMYRVFDMYRGGELRDWSREFKTLYDGLETQQRRAQQMAEQARQPGTSPSRPLGAYTGTYTDSLYGALVVTEQGGRLRAAFGKGFAGSLEHWHHNTFMARWDDRRSGAQPVTFVLDAAARVVRAELGRGRSPLVFVR